MKNLATDTANEMKQVITSLNEKLNAGKYRAFALQLERVTREYSDEFSAAGINNLSVLSDLYYMEGHDEQIKELLKTMDGVLDTYITYQNASDNLSEMVSKIVQEKDYVYKGELSRSLCSISDSDDELY